MKEYLKIAWRNLWRNRKRTAITSASILFAVFFALIMRSLELGSYDNMIKNVIEKYSGFIKIQSIHYQNDPSIDNAFEYSTGMIEKLNSIAGIKTVVPRVESFAFASTGNQTKGVVILGVDVQREKDLSNPDKLLIRYRLKPQNYKKLEESKKLPPEILEKAGKLINNSYTTSGGLKSDLKLTDEQAHQFMPIIEQATLSEGKGLVPDDDGLLVSDRLAKYLKLNIGDTLILMGQGYHSATAQGLFPVRGFIKVPAPDLDNKLVYMSLSNAQQFFGLENQLTSIAINLNNNSDKNMIAKQLEISALLNNKQLSTENWKEFNKVLWQQIEGDSQSGQAMLALLYFVIFFGIFGTVLMMIHERYREFGVLVSIGMQRTKLAIVLLLEMAFMGIIGVLLGIASSLPLLYFGHKYPIRLTGEMAQTMENVGQEAIMPMAWVDMYVLWQAIIVALMVILSCIYPLTKVLKLKEAEALRS
jgi:ABC-type lipoprotein release transport system permease subunit